MHRNNTKIGCDKHDADIPGDIGVFDLVLYKMDKLIKQDSCNRQFKQGEINICDFKIYNKKDKINQVKDPVMEKKKNR